MYFDTLTVTENLITAGMPDGQAKAIAREYANLMQHQVDQFATKEDIKRLDNKIDTKFNELRNELHHVEERLDTKIDTRFNELDKKIDTKFNELDKKIDTRFNELDTKIDHSTSRIIVHLWGIIATVAGLLFTACKLFL